MDCPPRPKTVAVNATSFPGSLILLPRDPGNEVAVNGGWIVVHTIKRLSNTMQTALNLRAGKEEKSDSVYVGLPSSLHLLIHFPHLSCFLRHQSYQPTCPPEPAGSSPLEQDLKKVFLC